MVVHAFDPNAWEAKADGSQIKASLVYIVSSRPAGAIGRLLEDAHIP